MEFENAIELISKAEPEIQAIYMFGSFGTADLREGSDVDIALLLPPGRTEGFAMSDLVISLADEFEMMVISSYQKWNEERQEIIEDGLTEGRFVA